MTPDDAARIMELRAQERSWAEIAAMIGVHPVTLWKWRKRHGLPPDNLRVTKQMRQVQAEYDEPRAAVIRGMRDLGYSWLTIAGALEVDEKTLISWRRKLGMSLDKRQRQHDPDWTRQAAAQVTDWLRGTSRRAGVRNCDNIPDDAEWLGGRRER